MNDKKESNTKDGVRSIYLGLYFLGAILSGAGGNYLWMRNVGPDIVAPDRFTGTQASALESKLDSHLRNHPDRPLEIRVSRLEEQYASIIRNQNRILDRLNDK